MNKRLLKTDRLVVCTKDIEMILGKKSGAARNYLRTMILAYNKKQNQFITFQEFRKFAGIDEEEIQEYLRR